MCLIPNKKLTEEMQASSAATIEAYKVIKNKLITNSSGELRYELTSPYFLHKYTPGEQISDRATKPDKLDPYDIEEGFHVCLTLGEAKAVLARTESCLEYCRYVIIKVLCNISDLIAVGMWSDWRVIEAKGTDLSMYEGKQAVFMKITIPQEEYDKAICV